MKSENEKKTRRVPTRMTQAQYKIIRQKALDRNMSVSAFVVEAAAHSDNKITIPQLIRIQNLANLVVRKKNRIVFRHIAMPTTFRTCLRDIKLDFKKRGMFGKILLQ